MDTMSDQNQENLFLLYTKIIQGGGDYENKVFALGTSQGYQLCSFTLKKTKSNQYFLEIKKKYNWYPLGVLAP